jgi:predicted nucleic acid-binding protein
MTRIFIDANVIIAVLNKEYPAFESCSRLLSLSGKKNIQLYCSTLSLSICFYFSSKKSGEKLAKTKIGLLMKHIKVSDCGEKEAKEAINNIKANDFEDAMQYHSAINATCSKIITLDKSGFYFSEIEVLSPEEFLTELSGHSTE